MSVNSSPIGGFAGQFFDNNGQPLSGGKIYTYAAGTTTPQATYTSSLGVTPHANPIVLDSAGRVPGGEIWLTDGLVYKFVIETATAILIGSYDNISGVNSNFVNYAVQEEVQTATAGQTVFNLTTINYTPGTNSLSVYVDGVNQYVGDSYLETDSNTVTFTAGLHVGAEVKFTTAVTLSSASTTADLVGYTPPFTGSAATNVEDKLAQYVSVKDFGAIGDGVTDDTAAIQAAVTASKAVDFGGAENNYRVNGTITLQSGQTLIGSATVTQDATQTILFNCDARDNVTVSGLRMVGKSEAVFVNTPSSLAIAIRANGATDVLVEDCRFENFYYTTLGVLTSGTRIRYINNFVKGPGAAVLGVDINYRNCIGVVILGDSVVISGNDIYDTATGIVLGQASSNAVIANNTLHDFINEHGVYVDTGVNNVTVASNAVRNTGVNGDGIKIQHYTSYGIAPRNCVVVGNTVEEIGNSGISVLNSVPTGSPIRGNGVAIVGNQVRNTAGIGINLRYWTDAVVSGNSTLTSAVEGIDITGCQNVLVSGNQIKDTQFSGVFIGAAGGNDRIKVQGNQIYHPGLVGGGSANASGVRVTGGAYVSLEDNRIIGDSTNLEYGVFIEDGDQTSLSVVENDVSGANYAIRYKNTADAPLALRDNRFIGVVQSAFNTAPLVSIASAASITIPTNARVVRITGTNNITDIELPGHTGSVVTLLFDDVLTVVRGGTLQLASNFTTSIYDTLMLCSDGNNWYEISRSAN